LSQQWEGFEKNKTPTIKRLYWLKRTDNGQYTGAEMNTQGEYAALLFGLHHHRSPYNSYGDNRSNQIPGMMTYRMDEEEQDENSQSPPPGPMQKTPINFDLSDNGALDLSVGVAMKPEHKLEMSQSMQSHSSGKISQEPISQDRDAGSSTMVCFTCGRVQPSTSAKFVYSRKQTDAVKYFPFLERLRHPPGAMPLTKQGLTRVCSSCWKSLQTQWKSYELSNTTEEQRVYRLSNPPMEPGILTPSPGKSPAKSEKVMQSIQLIEEACYICAQVYHKDTLKLLYAKEPYKGIIDPMYFTFIYSLKCPTKARSIDSDGRVMACRTCYNLLKSQWQAYEDGDISMANRTYRLQQRCAGDGDDKAVAKGKDSRVCDHNITKPLNIQISNASSPGPSGRHSQGLLAIAPPLPYSEDQGSREGDGKSFLANGDASRGGLGKVNQPDEVMRACYNCGIKSTASKTHIVSAYPLKNSQSSTDTVPFFPFLANVDAASGAKPIDESGNVLLCRYCYHSFVYQWHAFEMSTKPGDGNRWLRRYNITEFVCYSCTCLTKRKHVKAICIRKYPQLRGRQQPEGAILMDDGANTIVCVPCLKKLRARDEPAQVVLPPKMRKEKYRDAAWHGYRDYNQDQVSTYIHYFILFTCTVNRVKD
jgi:hypothetical protein